MFDAQDGIVLVGGGGHASDVMNLIHRLNLRDQVVGFLDDDDQCSRMISWGVVHLGSPSVIKVLNARIASAIGTPKSASTVLGLLKQSKCTPQSLVDPESTVGAGVSLGDGVCILSGARISPYAKVGNFTYLSQNISVGHDTALGDFCSVMPGAMLSGDCTVGSRVLIGTNATVLPGITIAHDAVIGAGAVVTKNIAEGITVIGNPAKQFHGEPS
jgi:sugar O-acyltransferase (sialic acid O-acetyltransferase NeuD family)